MKEPLRDKIYKMFDEGKSEQEITNETEVTKQVLSTYGYDYRQEREMSIEEFTQKVAPIERKEPYAQDVPKVKQPPKVTIDPKKEETSHKKTYVSPSSKQKASVPSPKSTLKLLNETKTYKGAYGEYTISDGYLTIILNDIGTSLEKPRLLDLIRELDEVGGLM